MDKYIVMNGPGRPSFFSSAGGPMGNWCRTPDKAMQYEHREVAEKVRENYGADLVIPLQLARTIIEWHKAYMSI